jgi:hypothetical protein
MMHYIQSIPCILLVDADIVVCHPVLQVHLWKKKTYIVQMVHGIPCRAYPCAVYNAVTPGFFLLSWCATERKGEGEEINNETERHMQGANPATQADTEHSRGKKRRAEAQTNRNRQRQPHTEQTRPPRPSAQTPQGHPHRPPTQTHASGKGSQSKQEKRKGAMRRHATEARKPWRRNPPVPASEGAHSPPVKREEGQ